MPQLPSICPGAWRSLDGAEMAQRYVDMSRERLAAPHMTDFELAHEVVMVGRYDLDLESIKNAAKDRIRWLSVQLVIANQEIELLKQRLAVAEAATADAEDELDAVQAANETCDKIGCGLPAVVEGFKGNLVVLACAEHAKELD